MNKSRILLTIFFSIFLISISWGQENRRLELPIPKSSEAYETIPIGDKGVILISQPEKKKYAIQKYSTDLEVDWKLVGDIEKGLEYVGSSYDGESVYLLFSKYRSTTYQVAKISTGPGFVENFVFTTIDRFEITEFKALGYSAYLAGRLRDEPVLIQTNLASGQSKVLPSTIKGANSIQAIEVDGIRGIVSVSFAVKNNRSMRMVVRTYDREGRSIEEVSVEPDAEYALLNGRLQTLNERVKLLVGTYGFANKQSSTESASQGLYIAKIVDGETQSIQFNSFTDFQNFFNFMSDRQFEKIERQIQKKKDQGKDLKLNYRLLVHDLIPSGDNYLIVAEVFYPEYKYNNNGMYGGGGFYRNPYMLSPMFGYGLYNPFLWNPYYSGRSMYGSNQVFDGFVYTHGIVASINEDGKLLWDNSINFEQVKSMQLKEKISVQVLPNEEIELVYSNKGQLTTKVIKKGRVLDQERNVPIETAFEGDKVKATETEEIAYWYGNYYLAWGGQRIANPNGEENRGRRNVFYLNKIAF